MTVDFTLGVEGEKGEGRRSLIVCLAEPLSFLNCRKKI